MANYKTLTFSMMPMMFYILSLIMFCSSLIFLVTDQLILMEWDLSFLMSSPLKMSLIIDSVSTLYASVVLFISANVMMFSKSYMAHDYFINRFSVLVFLFVVSMNLLIFIPHFMALLIGWDGLGITSFILVIYYQNPKSLAAGMITALTNRIGDVMILLAIALTLDQGHWNILIMDPMSANSVLQVLAIMTAAMTKSAQMPFSSWLPAAMAAPTPVSALVHSSTLVTAGVFLLIRFYPFLQTVPMFNSILLFTAVCTMFMAGISATSECDMKKIIALSTLSQLGMMMTTLGLGMPKLAFFHMVAHALFKALLFICAGTLISSHSHSQDLRWMGNIVAQSPMASSCILVSNSALCGIPFMAGFYSKDLIMEWMITSPTSLLMTIMSFLAIGLTMFYSIRFSLVVIWGPRLHLPLFNPQESNSSIIPMFIMSSVSILGGSLILWIIPFNIINPNPLPLELKLLPISMVVSGMIMGWLLTSSYSKKSASMLMPLAHFASCMMWFLVPLSSQFQLSIPMKMSHMLLKITDHSWLELSGAQGIYFSSSNKGNYMISISSGSPSNLILSSFIMSSILITIILT